MEQMSFNLNELLKREVKQILEGGEPYIYNLIDNDCIEKNAEGIQKQKKLIEEYLIDNKIPKQIKKEVHLVGETLLGKKIFNTLFYEGFYIEGYKIKYDYTKSLCYFKFDPKHNGIVNKYISSKLKDIYLLLKDKFDIVPRYTTIIEYDYIKTKDNLGRDVLKKLYETERQYNAIQYLEITKFKSNINVNLEIIDDIKNNIEEFILEVKEDFI